MCPALPLPDDGDEPKTFAEMQERYKAAHERLWRKPVLRQQEVFAPDPPKISPIPPPPVEVLPPPPVRVFEPVPPTRLQVKITGSPRPSIQLIIRTVSGYLDIPIEQISGQRRIMAYCKARQLIYYLCRELLAKSFPTIGRALGGRDHTTVMSGAKKFARRLDRGDEEATKQVADIKGLLGARLSTLPVVTCAAHDNDNRVGASPTSQVSEAPS